MVEVGTAGMVNGTSLTKEKVGVGNATQRNQKPQQETLVLGVTHGRCWDGRTLVDRAIQITTELGENKE